MDEPRIVYEDKNFVGIFKPEGMLVHKARTNADRTQTDAENSRHDPATLVDWLLKKYPEIKNVGDEPETRPGIVHRLDKGTSGIMLVPRNQEYFEYFKSLFKTRQLKKNYLAIVFGEPKEKHGIIDKPIGIKSGSVKRSVHSEKMLKSAVTEYKVTKTFVSGGTTFSLLEVFPKTGRTHQIRVHLASIGHPIVGDFLYGGKKQATFAKASADAKALADKSEDKSFFANSAPLANRLMLHAYSLEFPLQNGKRMKLEVEPDESFKFII